ncbi:MULTISPECIES: SDR family oxidoreductase [unclassified Mycobacterium]|uniref:SDR family NAD(P)-dependent oxidoreductase n=1 Tax=unclassified Mycobacterium TaxID=2642494 RepID=UPI0029C7BAA2|nr:MULTISPECIES: SDR family oxidoreductase [unclassified Mycobacterium]
MPDAPSVLITGASRGIGLEIAKHLAARGMALTITARNQQTLDALIPTLTNLGAPRICAIACDLADSASPEALVAIHRQTYGAMTALVLNAGVGTAGPIGDYPANRLDKTIAVNLRSPFLMIQAALPLLRRGALARDDQGAKVVVLSSITGIYAEAGLAAYGASKAALLSLVDTLNAEESANGITATAIAPAYVDTDMSAWTNDTVSPEAMIPSNDIAVIVDTLLSLSKRSVIGPIIMTRAGTTGYHA